MSFLEMLKLSFSFCEKQGEDEEVKACVETHKHNTPFLSRGAHPPTRNERDILEF